MIGVGQKFPQFHLKAVVSSDIKDAFTEVSNETYKNKWLVVFFWPKNFTFVCPTEIAEFGRLHPEFDSRDAQILGVSVDSEFVHLAWRQHHPQLKDLPFPMAADIKRELSHALGIIDPKEGVSQRATYLVDPDGIIRFIMITDLSVGRNVKEVLRILDALETGELCPVNWQKGEQTITVG